MGKDIACTTRKNQQQNLCQKNKPRLLPNSQPGVVYQLDCLCKRKYIGESKKTVIPRCIEHQQDSMSGKLEPSGAAEHTKECHGQLDCLHPKTLHISPYIYEKKSAKRSK